MGDSRTIVETMGVPHREPSTPGWFFRDDAGELLYGAIVAGATVGAISSHADSTTRVAFIMFGVLLVYWLAHVYVHALTLQLESGDTRLLPGRLRTAVRHELGVLVGGVPVAAVYVISIALGATPSTAGYLALSGLVVLLVVVGYTGAREVGLTGWALYAEALGAGLLGVLVMLMKALLH